MMDAVVLLDGGTGQELLNRSANQTPRHWSAEYLLQEPDLVVSVHEDYVKAGARVITINAYAATYTRMALLDEQARVPELQRIACELAMRARDNTGQAGSSVAIAGCLPPLNGSYRPDRVRDFEVNLDEYRALVAHQTSSVDLFICETMSSVAEARAAAIAATESGKPVWVGVSLKDGGNSRLRSGETIDDVARDVRSLGVAALVANCTAPESITVAMPDLAATGLPTGGYANGFTGIPLTFVPGRTREQLSARRDLDPRAYAEFALKWIDAGARIVGGCCEVGPAHIHQLHDAILEAGYQIGGPLDLRSNLDALHN